MTPLHHQIKSVLLPLCLEATAKFRDQPQTDTTKQDLANTLLKKIDASRHNNSINSFYVTFIIEVLAEVLDFPELRVDAKNVVYDPFTVIKMQDKPKLVLHGRHRHYLSSKGELKQFNDSPKTVASDEEIESYLDSLTVEQLRFLLQDDTCEPFLASLFEEQTELVPAESLDPDDIPL